MRVTLLYNTITKYIPDRTRVFLFGFWIWTWILFQLTAFANFLLGLIIKYLPNYLMPNVKSKTSVKVLKAIDSNGLEVTDKLKMYMNFKWDKNMFDEHGGVDLDIFLKYIGASFLWIAYILEYDISNDLFLKFINIIEAQKESESESEDDSTTIYDGFSPSNIYINGLKKCVKIALIKTKEKIIYKLDRYTNKLEGEDITFGEINFY